MPAAILAEAIADAAARNRVAPTLVRVVSAEARVWPNGALGCPQPGRTYTQALRPGYRIVLDAGGRRLDYRGGQRGVTLCENPVGPG